jgi:hypothetical protein
MTAANDLAIRRDARGLVRRVLAGRLGDVADDGLAAFTDGLA